MADHGYASRQVVFITCHQAPAHLLAYSELVTPSQRTPGDHSHYSFNDLLALKTAKQLIEAGISVRRVHNET